MNPGPYLTASRLVIVAGKGGVGKTVVSAALARAAALAGLTSLIVEVEGKSGMSSMFGHPESLQYDEHVLSPGGGPDGAADVLARTLTPDRALIEYLEDHGLNRVSKRLVQSGALDVVSTAVPGMKDILILGKTKQLERRDDLDLLVLDAPAAGHAITFLHAARSLLDSVSVGPINAQARDVMEMLTDPARCQVILVTLPEETPVNELVETAYALEDKVGVQLGPVVVNGIYPTLEGLDRDPAALAAEAGIDLLDDEADEFAAAAQFRHIRAGLQQEQVTRLADALPLPQIHLPYLFDGDLDPVHIDVLAMSLLDQLATVPAIEVMS